MNEVILTKEQSIEIITNNFCVETKVDKDGEIGLSAWMDGSGEMSIWLNRVQAIKLVECICKCFRINKDELTF